MSGGLKLLDSLIKGIGTFILGFLIVGVASNFFASGNIEHSYLYGITFSILFLAAIVVIATSEILKAIRQKNETIKDK